MDVISLIELFFNTRKAVTFFLIFTKNNTKNTVLKNIWSLNSIYVLLRVKTFRASNNRGFMLWQPQFLNEFYDLISHKLESNSRLKTWQNKVQDFEACIHICQTFLSLTEIEPNKVRYMCSLIKQMYKYRKIIYLNYKKYIYNILNIK